MGETTEIDFSAILNGTEKPEIDQVLESRKGIKTLLQSGHDRRFMSADEQIHWRYASSRQSYGPMASQSRAWIAKQYAEGDVALEEILKVHLDFTSGRIYPVSHAGILFFQVGENSTHEFYAGTRDGKMYSLSYDESEEDGQHDGSYHLSELEPGKGLGYVGHF